VACGVLLLVAGLVAAHEALASQDNATTAVIDRGVVDVTTQLGQDDATAAGTGILLTPTGEVLTNNHVIRGGTSITVTVVTTGRTYGATVVGYDPGADVAVLQLQGASGLPVAQIGNSSSIVVGDAVQAVGNVGGVGGLPRVADGSVVALGVPITAVDDYNGTSEQLNNMIETNADVRPGDSGGPLVNAGEVVGIDTAGSDSFVLQAGQGYGFAIPIDTAISLAEQIQRGVGTSGVHIGATAFIGVTTSSSAGSGAVVVDAVVAGSPADQAGIVAGDTMDSFDGTPLQSPDDLANLLLPMHPGQQASISWTDSSGVTHTASVDLASGPAA
jgi:S1-C subfamily serine protease